MRRKRQAPIVDGKPANNTVIGQHCDYAGTFVRVDDCIISTFT